MGDELTVDGIIREENPYWIYYIDVSRVPEHDSRRSGKWMYMTADLERAEELVREAVTVGAVIEAKCSTEAQMALSRKRVGVCCFYLNGDDDEAHRRVIKFMLDHNLVRRTKGGKLWNISFKFDDQTRAGEYGEGFQAKICLADFVDLETGEFITR